MAATYIHLSKESQSKRRWTGSVSCIMKTCLELIHIEFVRLRRVILGLYDLAKIVILSNVDVL